MPGRVIFELDDVMHSDLQLLQPYQEAFRAWQEEMSEVQARSRDSLKPLSQRWESGFLFRYDARPGAQCFNLGRFHVAWADVALLFSRLIH